MIDQSITEALKSAMAHSQQPMVLTDPNLPDHPMIVVNEAFEQLTGYPESETLGRNCRFLQGDGTDRQTTRRIRQCIELRRGCIEWVVNHRRDGTRFWNLLFISPVFARDGSLLHYFGNQRDITDGPPAGLGDFTFGRAAMPLRGQAEFSQLLLDIAEAHAADSTEALDQIVNAARRLNDLTTRLEPPPWSPFAA